MAIEGTKLTSNRIIEYMKDGKRFDGRKLDDFRDIEIELGVSKKAEGSAKVKMGNTEVWVGVKMNVMSPYPDSPDEGNLMVTAELLPLSHGKYEYGPPKFPAIELGRLVDRAIRESKLIDLKKLCIEKGEKVWNLFIDVYSINDDGNLLDAAVIGALAALKSGKMLTYDKEKEQVDYETHAKESIPITKNLPLNFSVYKAGDSIFLDPTLEEEEASEGRLVLAVIPEKPIRIHSMQKSEDMQLSPEEFAAMLDMVEKKHAKLLPEIEKKIDAAIKADK